MGTFNPKRKKKRMMRRPLRLKNNRRAMMQRPRGVRLNFLDMKENCPWKSCFVPSLLSYWVDLLAPLRHLLLMTVILMMGLKKIMKRSLLRIWRYKQKRYRKKDSEGK